MFQAPIRRGPGPLQRQGPPCHHWPMLAAPVVAAVQAALEDAPLPEPTIATAEGVFSSPKLIIDYFILHTRRSLTSIT